uniref:Large ribosomal subunit protein uL22 n=1 Tax=uncultured Nitrospirae bacterium Rifle_16ft_4_minimus_16961 TaxID=1665125 RepID=A0A0H4TLD7_9BACT|nr:50S ribosomal protein L22, large subunit ribosomal protein L22 [uncultured Nitrospirae bacterium Rifle_16ft_4_minimus_16961]
MEARAILRYARLAPRKGRRVIDLVRGKDVGEALTLLKFLPQHASFIIEKVLRSAIANAKQKNIGDIDDLVVSQAYVDPGPALKRFKAGPMGRAMQRKKCMSHITMVLSPRAGKGIGQQ